MSSKARVAIVGTGRMGQAIAARLEEHPQLSFGGMAGRGDDFDALLANADVLVDFSLPAGTERLLDAAVLHSKPLVCGVSGLSEPQMAKLRLAAQSIPIVYDRNMSQGVTVLNAVIRDVAAALGPEFAVRIEETHHIHKKDAPSGTALKLAETLAKARGISVDEVPCESERRGEVPGDHTISFSSENEVLTFKHSVTTRDVFAEGAIRAALWVKDRPAGQYSMQDVLFDV